MREITQLAVHCAATRPKMDIGVKEIRRWHLERGWRDIGYHYVIGRDGTVEDGRPNQDAGAHIAGHNKNTLGICLVGGVDDNLKPEANFTDAQMKALRTLLTFLGTTYNVPRENWLGHRDFGANKACPSFDVQAWLKTGRLTNPNG